VISWPGCEAPIGGRLPNYSVPYSPQLSTKDKMQQCLNWLDSSFSTRPSLLATYIGIIDETAHGYGLDSSNMLAAFEEVNEGFDILIEGLKERNLFENCHIVVVSDHGMSSTKDPSKFIYLSDYMDVSSQVTFIHDGPFTMLSINSSVDAIQFYRKLCQIGKKTGAFKAFTKNNLPVNYQHYRDNSRISDFILVSHIGYYIISEKSPESCQFSQVESCQYYNDNCQDNWLPKASHGYWPHEPSMTAFFLALGPQIKPAATLPSFSSLDIYPFLCRLLNMPPLHHNGTNYLISELLE
jgi:predicted AlkP superfamily pyrophosphatase or phosphodiesterase